MKVVFAGSGTFSVDETYESTGDDCTVQATDPMALSWDATYHTVIDHGVVMAATGSLDSGPGSVAFSATSTGAEGCSEVAPLAAPPCSVMMANTGPAPVLSVSGDSTDSPIDVQVQSSTAVGDQPACGGFGGPEFVGRDLSILGAVLPGGLTAVATIPAGALGTGSYLTHVSSANALTQPSSNCVASGVTAQGTEACTASMSWSGTLTFTEDCGYDVSVSMPCMKKQQKDDAQEAEDYDDLQAQAQLNAQGKCIGRMRGGCWVFSPFVYYYMHESSEEKQIVDDPPDSNFKTVAKPHPLRLPGFARLSRQLAHVAALLGDYARITGLQKAVITARNRATGAYVAYYNGNGSASADLAKQNHALLKYAGEASRLLDGQHRRALKACAQLRMMASRIHGRGSHRRVSAIRSLAASLISNRAKIADRHAAAALSGIGT